MSDDIDDGRPSDLERHVPPEHLRRGKGAATGATIGAITGSVVGGPIGAAIGGAIGAALGVAVAEKTGGRDGE